MSEQKEKNPFRRFIAKIKNVTGQYGTFQKIKLDNPSPKNADGTDNHYYQGTLLWLDAKTGQKFIVKQLTIRGIGEKSKSNGFVASVAIDLDNQYDVEST